MVRPRAAGLQPGASRRVSSADGDEHIVIAIVIVIVIAIVIVIVIVIVIAIVIVIVD